MQPLARIFVLLALLALAGCAPQLFWKPKPAAPVATAPKTEQQIEAALQSYSGKLLAMDADAVAQMYAPDGVWERQSGPLRGRDAIRGALAAAGGIRVISNQMTSAALAFNGPAVIQSGHFKQTVQLPNGDAVAAAGEFEATWVRAMNGEWWIRRMVTRPAK